MAPAGRPLTAARAAAAGAAAWPPRPPLAAAGPRSALGAASQRRPPDAQRGQERPPPAAWAGALGVAAWAASPGGRRTHPRGRRGRGPAVRARVAAGASAASSALDSAVVVACGLACLDVLKEVEQYPEADAKIRALATTFLGGGNAANTACALSRLGTPVALLSKVGVDALGDIILTGLQEDGVHTDGVLRAPGRTSAFSTVLVDRSSATRTSIHSPCGEDLTGDEVGHLLAERQLLGPDVRLVHLDGRHPEAALELARAARGRGLLVSMDCERPRPGLEELLPLCDVVFCNASFPEQWTGEAGLPRALAEMLQRLPEASVVLATRGARGPLLMARRGEGAPELGAEELRSAGLPVACCEGSFGEHATLACDAWPLGPGEQVVDTTGAGDVFIAGFLHARLAGRPLAACLAAGACVASQKLRVVGARLGPGFDAGRVP